MKISPVSRVRDAGDVTDNGMRKHSASCDAIILSVRFYFLLRICMQLAPAE
jgi:hypothetical protein